LILYIIYSGRYSNENQARSLTLCAIEIHKNAVKVGDRVCHIGTQALQINESGYYYKRQSGPIIYPVNTTRSQFVSRKLLTVINHVVINRPIGEVARYAAHPDSAPQWYTNIKEVTWLTSGEFSVGSIVAFRAEFLGKSLSYSYIIKEFIPGHRLVMTTAEGPFPMTTEYVWTATKDGHTKMTLKNSGKPTGFAWYVKPLLRWSMNRANQKDLRLLKSILEQS